MTAVIGAGGKTTLVRALAEELAGDGPQVDSFSATSQCSELAAGPAESRSARVIVATSTKMFAPDWCPVLLDDSLDEVRSALMESPIVCVGTIHKPTGKLSAPSILFPELANLAEYVLVEADGAKTLPLKAHADHEPVIPDCACRVVCVAGVDGVGKPISQACHRSETFARLAGVSPDATVTPEAVAAVLNAEALHDVALINKVHTAADWQVVESTAVQLHTAVVAGSLQKGEFRCLR